MKTTLITLLAGLGLASAANAQFSDMQGGLLLGGGYIEDPGKAYGFGQIRGTFYEDDTSAHTFFLELLGHTDDAVLEYTGRGGRLFLEDGDITFVNLTANYEIEIKFAGPISFFAGAGAGLEFVSLDDSFDYSIDNDTNFVAQGFGGLRAHFPSGFMAQMGARYLVRDDFALLGDQFLTNDSWSYELSLGFKF